MIMCGVRKIWQDIKLFFVLLYIIVTEPFQKREPQQPYKEPTYEDLFGDQ